MSRCGVRLSRHALHCLSETGHAHVLVAVDDTYPARFTRKWLADCADRLVAPLSTPGTKALARQEAAPTDLTHRHTGTLRRASDGHGRRRSIRVEALAGLAAELAGLQHPDEPWRRRHPRLAQLLVESLACVHVDVRPDKVE